MVAVAHPGYALPAWRQSAPGRRPLRAPTQPCRSGPGSARCPSCRNPPARRQRVAPATYLRRRLVAGMAATVLALVLASPVRPRARRGRWCGAAPPRPTRARRAPTVPLTTMSSSPDDTFWSIARDLSGRRRPPPRRRPPGRRPRRLVAPHRRAPRPPRPGVAASTGHRRVRLRSEVVRCPGCSALDDKVVDSRTGRRRRRHPPTSRVPVLRPAVHHLRADRRGAAHRRQAVWSSGTVRAGPSSWPGMVSAAKNRPVAAEHLEPSRPRSRSRCASRGRNCQRAPYRSRRADSPARPRRGRLPALRQRLQGLRATPTTSSGKWVSSPTDCSGRGTGVPGGGPVRRASDRPARTGPGRRAVGSHRGPRVCP